MADSEYIPVSFKAQFDDDDDDDIARSYLHFFAENSFMLPEARIIVTLSMKAILCMVMEKQSNQFVICGPHGCGKTTTLYWLYHQLKARNFKAKIIDIQNPPLVTSFLATPPLDAYLCDLNGIGELSKTPEKFSVLKTFLNWVIIGKVLLIFATTSAFYASGQDKLFGDTYHAFAKFQLEGFTENECKEFFKLWPLLNLPDEGTLQKIMKASGGLPGFLRIYFFAKSDMTQFQILMEDDASEDIQETCKWMNDWEYHEAVELLLAAHYEAIVNILLPTTLEKANILYINENSVPVTYVPLSQECLKKTIRKLAELIPAWPSKAIIADIFISKVGSLFQTTILINTKLCSSQTLLECELPKMFCSPAQYKAVNKIPVVHWNQLWPTPLDPIEYRFINYFGICQVSNIGNVLLTVICTLKKTENGQRLNMVFSMPQSLKDLALKECEGNVVVLYINPEMEETFDDLLSCFRDSCRTNLKYHIAVPTDNALFQGLCNELCLIMRLKN